MSHYYINDDSLKSDIRSFTYTFGGHVIRFTSDSGVFARNRVDFGTNVLLNSLPDLDNLKILDVGCGVGVIGLSIAKRYSKSFVTLIDINKKAIDLTIQNAKNNNIKNVQVFESDVYSNVTGKFDVVVTNPPIRAGKLVVHKIVDEAFDLLNDGGSLIVVIQKKQGAPSLKKFILEKYQTCEEIGKDSGYLVFQAKKSFV